MADAHCLPLVSGTVDLVICHNAFPHFRDKAAALAELRRALGDGGYLLILHDLGRERVNRIYREAGGAIGNDLLPPGEGLAQMLAEDQFGEIRVKDTADQFQAVARRVAGFNGHRPAISV